MKLRLFYSVLCFFVALNASAKTTTHFCGYSPSYGEMYYPILDQSMLVDASLHPFMHCPWSNYCYVNEPLNTTSENVMEWHRFLGDNISEEETITLVYGTSVTIFKDFLEGKNGRALDKLPKKIAEDFSNYMLLAKDCQGIRSIASGGSGWRQGEDASSEKQNLEVLLERAFAGYQATSLPFLKNRYGFQMVRLAHYLQENEAAIGYFEDYVTLDTANPYIYYRALEQKSGAEFNLKNKLDAARGFAEVYVNLPSRRLQCATSLQFLDFASLDLNVVSGGDVKMKDVLYFLRSFHYDGNIKAEITAIEKQNPDSEYLKLIAVREADKIQYEIFNDVDERYGYGMDSRVTPGSINMVQELAKRQIARSSSDTLDFWKIVLATTLVESKKYTEAIALLDAVQSKSVYYAQAERFTFSIKTLTITNVDSAAINALYLQLKNTEILYEKQAVTAFFFNHVSGLYKNQGNLVFSLLGQVYNNSNSESQAWGDAIGTLGSAYGLSYKNEFIAEDIINELQAVIDIKNKTDYEKLVLSTLKVSPQDYAYDLMGNLKFEQNKLKEAISYYEKIKSPENFYEKNIRTSLFAGAINEKFDRPFAPQSDEFQSKYEALFPTLIKDGKPLDEYYIDNKPKLAQTLLTLERLVVEDHENTSDYFYMLGNAWFNLSEEGWFNNTTLYLGNSSRNTFLEYNYETESDFDQHSSSYINQSITYFKKALTVNGVRETKAKATFMLAKTHRCYDQNDNNRTIIVCGDHKAYFTSLKEDYSDTKYQAQVLRECTWYRDFY